MQLAALGTTPELIAHATEAPPATAGPAVTPFQVKPFQWAEATLGDLEAAMNSGQATAVALTEAFLRRIDELDQRGPALKSVSSSIRTPWRLRLRSTTSARRAARVVRCTASLSCSRTTSIRRSMPPQRGRSLSRVRSPSRSFVAQKLCGAGAIILGKTN